MQSRGFPLEGSRSPGANETPVVATEKSRVKVKIPIISAAKGLGGHWTAPMVQTVLGRTWGGD